MDNGSAGHQVGARANPLALVRMRDVQALTGLARPTIYKAISRDPSFPRPVKLSDSTARNAPVAFVLSEVEEWISRRIKAREMPQ